MVLKSTLELIHGALIPAEIIPNIGDDTDAVNKNIA